MLTHAAGHAFSLAVHNLKTKYLDIILTQWTMILPISALLLFLVSEGKECARFCHFLVYFWRFLHILPQF